jgi:hypothetical protein
MLKIYVGFSITGAPPEFIARVQELREALREHFEVMEFVPVTEGTCADVYRNDIKECVANCDLMVAICDHPSTGLGYEMCYAAEVAQKPLLAVAHHGSNVSRLIQGIDQEKFTMKRYQELGEVVRLVRRKATEHFGARP